MLQDINDDLDLLDSTYKNNTVIKMLFAYAFDPDLKFDLPKKIPNYRQDKTVIGLASVSLLNELRRLYVFAPSKALPQEKKEQIFLQMVENMAKEDADILIAIRQQKLSKLFKKLTHKNVAMYGFKVSAAAK